MTSQPYRWDCNEFINCINFIRHTPVQIVLTKVLTCSNLDDIRPITKSDSINQLRQSMEATKTNKC